MENKNPIEKVLGKQDFTEYVVLLAKAKSDNLANGELRRLNMYFKALNDRLPSESCTIDYLDKYRQVQDEIRQKYPDICAKGKLVEVTN